MSAVVREEILTAAARPSPALAVIAPDLAGRTVWHVNTTALGGGVAELIRQTVPAHEAAGVRSRWLVTSGNQRFFAITKQLHHLLHAQPGDGHLPNAEDQRYYRDRTADHAAAIAARAAPGDVAVLHDPQTLGLASRLRDHGMYVIWRSHIGSHRPSPWVDAAWQFLASFVAAPHRMVFSSAAYRPVIAAGRPVTVMPPAIDPTAVKSRPMTPPEVSRVLAACGLQEPAGEQRTVRVIQETRLPRGADVILQIARWDPLKDMAGVLGAFADWVAAATGAHLVLAGPDPDEVRDDFENQAVLVDVLNRYGELPADVRARVHILVMSLTARTDNHTLVNALQRRATVVVQKSLEEGFGMAVAEARLKGRAVVASDVGGLREQVRDGADGILVPADAPDAFAAAVCRLLADPGLRGRLGAAARRHCRRRYLLERENQQYVDLFAAAVAR